MRMSEGPHILDFSLDPGLCLGCVDDLFGDKLHGHLVSCDGVESHCGMKVLEGDGDERGAVAHTLDLAESSLSDVLSDSVLSQLGCRVSIWNIGHDVFNEPACSVSSGVDGEMNERR